MCKSNGQDIVVDVRGFQDFYRIIVGGMASPGGVAPELVHSDYGLMESVRWERVNASDYERLGLLYEFIIALLTPVKHTSSAENGVASYI